MIRSLAARIARFVSDFLQRPHRVLVVCLALLFIGLFFDGSLLRLWILHRDSRELAERIEKLRQDSAEISMKIKQANDPQFIEIQARDRFEMAGEGDLIFVFSDDGE